MRWLLTLALLALAPWPAAAQENDDAKRIQGTWVVDPAVYKDLKDKDAIKEMMAVRIIFDGESCTTKHPPGNEEKGSFRLDPSKKPKQIDLLGKMGNLQAQGIYELEKDSLKLCWDRDFKTRGRPTKFANTQEVSDPFLLVLVREKKEAEAGAAVGRARISALRVLQLLQPARPLNFTVRRKDG
jgi:uncharacterized protein (TIGR03067 family)